VLTWTEVCQQLAWLNTWRWKGRERPRVGRTEVTFSTVTLTATTLTGRVVTG
jgi:hypothetical protein